MQKDKKTISLRAMVLTVVGVSLLIFISIFFYIFKSTTSHMILRTEERYLREQLDVITGTLDSRAIAAESIVADISQRAHVDEFVRGEYDGFIEHNWPERNLLKNYLYNLVFIKDLNGNDIYADFFDFLGEEDMEIPSGFSSFVASFSRETILKAYAADEIKDIADFTMSGVIFYDNEPYFIAVVPILSQTGDRKPVGTMIVGNILSDEYFQFITHLDEADFKMSEAFNHSDEYQMEILDRDHISASMVLKDIYSRPLDFYMTTTRDTYLEESRAITTSTAMLFIFMAMFIAALYVSVLMLVLRPIEHLSRDLEKNIHSGDLDVKKYSKSNEFVTLCSSINDMVRRINESNFSISAMSSILDGIDVSIFVSDVETDEILFLNRKIRQEFNIPSGSEPKRCWDLLQSGQDSRCEWCPIPRLIAGEEDFVEWEKYYEDEGRYFRNTNGLIRWTDNRIVNLQSMVDITNERLSEISLKKRLDQQELMASISQGFISSGTFKETVDDALAMTGSFLNAGKIMLVRYDTENGYSVLENVWYNEDQDVYRLTEASFPFDAGDPFYDAFFVQKLPYITIDSVQGSPFEEMMGHKGVKSFITVPLYVYGVFWGLISIDICDEYYSWIESDIHLVRLIASVISGAIGKRITDENLIRMSSISNSSPHFVCYFNSDGSLDYINNGASYVTGYSMDELMDGGLSTFMDDRDFKRVHSEIIPAVLEEGQYAFEMAINRKDGEEKILAFSAFKTELDNSGFGAIASDVTDNRRLQEDLVRAKEQAEDSSRAKGDFLSRMSHEMRTPMNAIIGMSNIGRSSDDIKKKDYCLDKIDEASVHLLGVINDILDMSKIEANKFELYYTTFNFRQMLTRTCNVLSFRSEEKNQVFTMDVDDRIPDMIISDEQRISQVVTNLLSNAVKFTPEYGRISLSAVLISGDEKECTIDVSVKDEGIGIEPENLSRLFRSFEQSDGGISRKFGGTGLGLAISKSIVEMLGGDISVASVPGQGSDFSFRIKVEIADPEEISNASIDEDSAEDLSGIFKGKTILLAEDIEINREIVLTLLEDTEIDVISAEDGAQAAKLYSENEDILSLIFMDIHMPDVDGYMATRMIRAMDTPKSKAIPIVAMTANVFREDIERCLDAGMNSHIGKPIDFDEMVGILKKYLL